MSSSLSGLLVIISGPSGAGKGTLITEMKKKHSDFVYPISMTTRDMRPGEQDGESYYYTLKEDFEKRIAAGEFLEWANVHHQNYYGTLKAPITEAVESGKIVVREVDVQGFHAISELVPKSNLLTIFIKVESLDVLISRIKKRSHLTEDEVKRRMASAEIEMQAMPEFDKQVWSIDGRAEDCYKEVEQIILARAGAMNIQLKGEK